MFVVVDDFIDKIVFDDIKARLPPMSSVKSGVRSHADLSEADLKAMAGRLDGLSALLRRVNSRAWWERLVRDAFGSLPRQKLACNPFSLDFRANYVEPLSGAVNEKDLFLYSRIDLGYGVEGYGKDNGGRGVHIDMSHRLVSGLLYMTGQRDMVGGELQVWSKPGGHMIREIETKPNRAVLSIQDETAWHRVNPIVSCKRPRIAFYFALSSSRPLWRTR